MDQYVYAVYDLKAKQIAFGILSIMPSDGSAQRWFEDMIRRPGSVVHDHPDDFVLVRVGLIDQDVLSVKSYNVGPSEPVVTGTAIVRYNTQPPEEPEVSSNGVEPQAEQSQRGLFDRLLSR